MRKNRYYLLNSIIFILVILNLSCGRNSGDDRIPLRFMFWGGFKELEIWEKVERDYEKMYPNVDLILEYSPVPMSDYDKKLRLGLINNTAPDVAIIDDDLYPSYAMYGHLENLEPYIQADSAELGIKDFMPTSLESFSYKGTQYALPWDGFSTLIIYNQDIFDKYQIPYPEDDWTWEDFRKTAWLLTFDFDGDGQVDQFGGDIGETFLDLENLLWAYGADILDENREYFTMNSPQTRTGLQFAIDLKNKFHCQPRWGEMSVLGSEIQILTGKIAMKLAPCYVLMNLFAASNEGLRWGIVQIPTGPYGKASRVSWDGIAIYGKSKYKQESWNLIKYILSSEMQQTIGRLKRAVPVKLSDANVSFADPTTPQKEEKYIEGFKYGRLTPVTDKIGKMRHLMDRYFDRIKLNSIVDDSIAAAVKRLQDYSLNKDLTNYEKLEKINVTYSYSPEKMLNELEQEMKEIFPIRRIDKTQRKINP